jgi:hypothetical protein
MAADKEGTHLLDYYRYSKTNEKSNDKYNQKNNIHGSRLEESMAGMLNGGVEILRADTYYK